QRLRLRPRGGAQRQRRRALPALAPLHPRRRGGAAAAARAAPAIVGQVREGPSPLSPYGGGVKGYWAALEDLPPRPYGLRGGMDPRDETDYRRGRRRRHARIW